MATEQILTELRALTLDASPALRQRVRALGEPRARRNVPALPWRRSLLLLAPVCALGLVLAAVIHGIASSGTQKQELTFGRGGNGSASDSGEHFGAVVD